MADSNKAGRILDVLFKNVVKMIDVDLFYVTLFNKVTVQLDFPLVAKKVKGTLKRIEVEGQWTSRPYQPDERLPDRILASGQPVLIETDFGGWIAANKVTYPTDERPLSWLGVPMIARGSVIGVIVAENYRHEQAYEERTSTTLAAIADRVASAISSARLVESLGVVNEVGQKLTSDIRLREDQVLELIYGQISRLMNTDSIYIALHDAQRQMLSFPLATEWGKREKLPSRRIEIDDETKGGLTEIVIRTRQPLCIANVEVWCKEEERTLPIPPIPKSWLGVPMMLEKRLLGIISLRNYEFENLYGQDDQEVLQTIAGQAAVAIDNARLYYDTNQRLAALINVGQKLNSSIRLQQEDVLELIYQQASLLMDTRNFFIALYDAEQQTLSFPLATEWGKREKWPLRRVEIDDETKGGLTEIVIRTRQPLCIANVEVWCKEEERTLPIPPIPKSWLGVPMMLEDRVLGVISLQSDEFENLYGRDDQEVLQAMASQAAIALDNAALLRKIREEQTKNVATGRLAAVHSVTAEFVHRMNNVAGTIPVRVEQIKELLDLSDSKYSKIVHYLEAILEDTDSILEAAQTITSSTRTTESLELVDIDTLVSTAIQRIAVPTGITVENKCEPDLPSVLAFSGQLLDTLENLIRNGVEAIEDSGSVTIVGRPLMEDGQRWVAVEIEDTGHGIPPGDLPRIFDLFFSTKPGGMGFGLWGAKTLIESLGGRIDVSSEVGKGTTFTILLSAEKEA